ncbi:hypothetical protein AB6E21_16220 [Photobacterium swingsii]|uniref:hypothetical protein n=1 Tax=Photobacterium swingsii TaxID=680026 RepID=UPI003554721D
MKIKNAIALAGLLLWSSVSNAKPTDSDKVELIVGVKKAFSIGTFPPEVHMKIDPFEGKHDGTDLFIPINWSVDKNIKVSAQFKCSDKDYALCTRLWVSIADPSSPNVDIIILDKSQEPKSVLLDKWFHKKITNGSWKFSFGAWGALNTPIEARDYKAKLSVQIESDV